MTPFNHFSSFSVIFPQILSGRIRWYLCLFSVRLCFFPFYLGWRLRRFHFIWPALILFNFYIITCNAWSIFGPTSYAPFTIVFVQVEGLFLKYRFVTFTIITNNYFPRGFSLPFWITNLALSVFCPDFTLLFVLFSQTYYFGH
jgi:hypothetical protein